MSQTTTPVDTKDPSCGCLDKPLDITGKVPATINFKCPADLCDDNNNKKEDTCSCGRPMPKVNDCCKPAADACEKKDSCVAITNKISDVMVKCGLGEKKQASCEEEKPKCDSCQKTDKCNCSRTLPKLPPPCGCNGKGSNCGPNNSCEVEPLTMQSKKS